MTTDTTRLCIRKDNPNPVKLTLRFDESEAFLATNAHEFCDEVQTGAFLGHTSAKSATVTQTDDRRGDRDTFAFEGEGGEVVAVTLENDVSDGNTGNQARSRVQNDWGVVLDQQTGSLPLEAAVTLLETGTFEVVAEETAGDRRPMIGGEPFRGHYLLKVAPHGGADDVLAEPQPDVDP